AEQGAGFHVACGRGSRRAARGQTGGMNLQLGPRRLLYCARDGLRWSNAGGNAMKFGIFYEISVPRPWDRETEKRVYDNCLEQVVLADELGFDQVWAVEHHFLEEYSHCSAPEIFLTAAR